MEKFFLLFRIPDLRKKIVSVLFLLLIFRILAAIPIPGIDASRLADFLNSNQLFGFLNIFSGGGFENLSIVMLGVGPYITATIIMQLLTLIFPQLKKYYYEEGAAGRAKFNRISRYLTPPLAAIQAYAFLNLLASQQVIQKLAFSGLLTNIIIITAGSAFLMWLGELISEYKIGNGISLLIFAGIVSRIPRTIFSAAASYTPEAISGYLTFAILAILIIAGVVFVSEGERKIPVAYAKQVRGMKLYGGSSSYLPLRVNQAGVIPIIFAISVLLFPQFIAQTVSVFSPDLSLKLVDWVNSFFNNAILYSLAYFLLVFIFTYFYTSVTFDPKEIAKNLQQSGGFIPGVRPGQSTADVIRQTVSRTTLFGAIFLGFVAVLPNLTQMITGIKIVSIGGTALLIVVAVALEVLRQIEGQLTMREYEKII